VLSTSFFFLFFSASFSTWEPSAFGSTYDVALVSEVPMDVEVFLVTPMSS
jgi:hypothetical protein